MLNKTSSYHKDKNIDFTVMGLNEKHSELLNWAMRYYDNCETLKNSNFMESKAMMVEAHFDDLMVIRKVKKPNIYDRP